LERGAGVFGQHTDRRFTGEPHVRCYYIWDEQADHGRYLSMRRPAADRIAMTGVDWAHNSRTSIYVTPERRIGIIVRSATITWCHSIGRKR